MPPARPRATLIYNPNAGRRRHARTLEAIRSALGVPYELAVAATEAPGDAIRLAREAGERGAGAVFAWGGDGTVREVVEGIRGSAAALGVLPGGTFNVVAMAIGLPRRNPVRAAAMLATATPVPRDVGLIESTPFLMQATVGLDGFLMSHMRTEMKARYGFLGVAVEGFRALSRYRFPQFEVEVDGSVRRVTGAGFVNMTEYAGRYQFVPGARWDDGKAHALLYTGKTRLAAASFAVGLGLGRHHLRRDVEILPARRMTIGATPGIFVQADGDPWKGSLPASCQLAAERIQVLIPR